MTAVEWVTERGRFEEIAAPWDDLAATSGTPFATHAWLAGWWHAFGTGPTGLRICVIWEGDRIGAGLALRSAGSSLQPLANYHTPSFPVLGRSDEAIGSLAAALRDARATQTVLEPLPGDEATERLLAELRATQPGIVRVQPLRTSPIVETAGDFASWRNETKSRWGAPLERFRRKADREHGLGLRLIEPATDLEAELSEGFQLEAAGWKGQRGTAILSQPDTERFYREVAGRFHERGELRLCAMRFGERLVAFDLCLLLNRRLYLLKTAYDESMRKVAPGLVMRLCVIERCFESEIEAFELLGAADEWKLKFSTTHHRYLTVRIFRRSPRGLGAYAYRRGLRPALRRGVQAARAVSRRLRR